jgi:exodeoxyribonuclease-3
VRLATWNINGIKARHERLLAFLSRQSPDVVCLQEIKSEDEKFPREAYEDAGYRVVTFGQKGYNGVALLSREPITDVARGFGDGADDEQSRFIVGPTCGLRVASIYVPNGGDTVGGEKYLYKLDWLARFREFVAKQAKQGWAIGGDYNVAPADLDVHDPVAWQGSVLCSDAERAALATVVDEGLVDVLRQAHPDAQIFTWWDYRMLGFQKNKGLRIDHVLATPDVAARVTAVKVDREERKGKLPSDHAPVLVDLDQLPRAARAASVRLSLPTLEDGVALLSVGGEPFGGIFRREQLGLQLALEGEALLESHLGAALHRPLDATDGQRRPVRGGESAGVVLDLGAEIGRRGGVDQAVHQAELSPSLERHGLALDHQLDRPGFADEAREPLRPAGAGQHAERDLGQADLPRVPPRDP